jgi:hypothetical protein
MVTAQPSCASGPVAVHVGGMGNGGNCGTSLTPLSNNPPGACGTDVSPGVANFQHLQVSYTPSGPTGGTCDSGGQGASSALTYAAQDRLCSPDSPAAAGCSGNACTPSVPAPYLFCVARSGTQSCPAPFTQQHIVGNNVTFSCSSCKCTVTSTCSGTVKLFTDLGCNRGEIDVTADGACHDPMAMDPAYLSYQYVPDTPQASCQVTGTSTAQNVVLMNTQTVCCLH